MDFSFLHMVTDQIINLGVNRDLVADSIINIARKLVAFGVNSILI